MKQVDGSETKQRRGKLRKPGTFGDAGHLRKCDGFRRCVSFLSQFLFRHAPDVAGVRVRIRQFYVDGLMTPSAEATAGLEEAYGKFRVRKKSSVNGTGSTGVFAFSFQFPVFIVPFALGSSNICKCIILDSPSSSRGIRVACHPSELLESFPEDFGLVVCRRRPRSRIIHYQTAGGRARSHGELRSERPSTERRVTAASSPRFSGFSANYGDSTEQLKAASVQSRLRSDAFRSKANGYVVRFEGCHQL